MTEPINRVVDHGDTYSIPYNPDDRDHHRWEEMFMDIPLTAVQDPGGLWQASPGTIFLPHTAARLAQHVELCGFDLSGTPAMQRVDIGRGVHRWQDATLPVPESDPVEKVQTVANAVLTTSEKQALIERLQADLDDIDLDGSL